MAQLEETNKIAAGTFYDCVKLVQAEYSEMPGLHLSKRQAQRLWNLDARSCDVLFEALEASHFLRRTTADSYVRADIDKMTEHERAATDDGVDAARIALSNGLF